jgi:hypothetical protein
MKSLLTALLFFIVFIACKNTPATSVDQKRAATDTAKYTTIQWIDSIKNVGNVQFGETVSIPFKFKNTGNYPLMILSAEPGCGCTVTDFPKKAIAPGEEGTITAAFDSNKGHEGEFRKNINVSTNTKGSTSQVLYFMGTILKSKPDSSSK